MRDYRKILLCRRPVRRQRAHRRTRASASRAATARACTLLHVVEYVPVEPMGEALLPAVQIEGELVERARKRLAELGEQARARHRAPQSSQTGSIKAEIVRIAQERRRRPDRARQPRAPWPGDPAQFHRRHRPARGALRRARRAPARRTDARTHDAGPWILRQSHDPRRRRDELRRGAVETHDEGRFVFAYTITIRNEGQVPARLLTRHWVITDANGKVQEVARRRRRRRAALPAAGPGLPLFQRRRARDAGRRHAGQLPDGRGRRRALRRADRAVHARDARHAALSDGRWPSYAIGDVQGCATSSTRCSDELDFDARRDRLWFVGDLVNRGPDSLDVLRRVTALGDAAIVVLGNHDLHLLARRIAATRGSRPRRHARRRARRARSRTSCSTGCSRRPLLHHDAALGYTMVHAGLPPQWDLATAQRCAREVEAALRGERSGEFFAHMYGDQPDRWREDLAGPRAAALHRSTA